MIIHIAATKLNQSQNPRFFLVIFKQLYAYTNPLNSFRYFFFYLFIYIWLYFCLDRDLFSLYVFRLFFGTLCCCALNAFCKSYNLHGWLVGWLVTMLCLFFCQFFLCVVLFAEKIILTRLFRIFNCVLFLLFCQFLSCYFVSLEIILLRLPLYTIFIVLFVCSFLNYIIYLYCTRYNVFGLPSINSNSVIASNSSLSSSSSPVQYCR